MKPKSLSGRVEIYIGKDLKKAVIDSGLNLSQFVREKLEEYFKAHGIEIKREEPELVLLVRCPSCGFKNRTSSIRFVRCKRCKTLFRVYLKRGRSRIEKILKGDRSLLFKKKYNEVYGKGGW